MLAERAHPLLDGGGEGGDLRVEEVGLSDRGTGHPAGRDDRGATGGRRSRSVKRVSSSDAPASPHVLRVMRGPTATSPSAPAAPVRIYWLQLRGCVKGSRLPRATRGSAAQAPRRSRPPTRADSSKHQNDARPPVALRLSRPHGLPATGLEARTRATLRGGHPAAVLHAMSRLCSLPLQRIIAK